jgi:RNA polymerase sigma-70 factor (ECF subfamily)
LAVARVQPIYASIVSGFRTTRWSLVAAAVGSGSETRASLNELCRIYWPPVYSFVRRSGHDAEAALDLTQGFFTSILERNDLVRVDPRRGRFRSYLLGALKHFLANHWRHENAVQNGGGIVFVPIDAILAEEGHAREPADGLTPEQLYDQQWALTLLAKVMDRLERVHAAPGKRKRFDALKRHLTGDEPSYNELAAELGEAPGTLRVQRLRLKRRYRDVLRDEVAEIVRDPAEIDDELRNLRAALM